MTLPGQSPDIPTPDPPPLIDPVPTEPTEVIPVPVTAAEILQSTPSAAIDDQDHLDQQLAELVHRSRRYLWLVIIVLALLLLGLTGAVVYLIVNNENATEQNRQAIIAAQAASDRRWCATFELLTRAKVTPPPNPASNPSRVANYQLYTDFITLKNQFHCS